MKIHLERVEARRKRRADEEYLRNEGSIAFSCKSLIAHENAKRKLQNNIKEILKRKAPPIKLSITEMKPYWRKNYILNDVAQIKL